MKTEDILNLDCRKEENRQKIIKFLWKIKPMSKLGIPKGSEPSIEELELLMHKLMMKYDYVIDMQGIRPYYEDMVFRFYQVDILKDARKERIWCGCVYGVTLWEVIAKIIIKLYGEVMKGREN